MKLENKGAEFEILYDYKPYVVPRGFMEIDNHGLATHILSRAKKWGLEVIKISDTSTIDIRREIKQEEIGETIEKEKEDVKSKTVRQKTEAKTSA